jgi:hypothetical protein
VMDFKSESNFLCSLLCAHCLQKNRNEHRA